MGARRWICLLVLAGMSIVSAHAATGFDCEGPAPDAEPGTPEWAARDAGNMFCAEQRHLDQAGHPLPIVAGPAANPLTDAYRDPARHNGVRFRLASFEVGGLIADVYRPCAAGTCPALPAELRRYEPPYPVIVILHGLAGRRDEMWWAAQPLSEAGYLVVSFDGDSVPAPSGVLDWLLDDENVYRHEIDPLRIGIAGTSAGGGVAMRFGQADSRISAIVGWDPPGGSLEESPARIPTLFLLSDYQCYPASVCQPRVYQAPPDPEGPGDKGEEFERLRAAGVDSMKIVLRASLHFDFISGELAGNRYAEAISLHYTLAWFDRYLRGASDEAAAASGYARLTAPVFDDSVDPLNISQGTYDPARAVAAADVYAGNVPYRLMGKRVADRLSFYYRSKCDLGVPGTATRVASDDIRAAGCR